MFDFIRAEYLNLIIARKQFVKDSKENLKKQKKQSAALKKIENSHDTMVSQGAKKPTSNG